MRYVPTSRSKRPKFWSKDAVASDILGGTDLSIRGLCKTYAPEGNFWRMLYLDIWRWRKVDDSFDDIVRKHIERVSPNRSLPGVAGRKRKDGGDVSWQDDFCDALIKNNGNRAKAAEVTPYSFHMINRKLNKVDVIFDQDFLDKVRTAELTLAAAAEEAMFSSIRPENFQTSERAKIAQSKAWIAEKILQRMDVDRWGKRVELEHKGNVNHTHVLSEASRRDALLRLANEQRMLMGKKVELITAPAEEPVEVVVDAEVVNEPLETREG